MVSQATVTSTSIYVSYKIQFDPGYSYTTFYEYHMTGVSPMRPPFFEFPMTTDLKGEYSQYLFMFGHALLIKPATFIDDEKE